MDIIVLALAMESSRELIFKDLKDKTVLRSKIWKYEFKWFFARLSFLGINLAKSLEAKINQTITITNPKNLVSKNVIVKGIFYGGDESDELMFVDISISQALDEEKVINYANAVINLNFDKISNLSKELSNDLINAKPIAQISLSEGSMLDKIKGLMALIGLVILIISSTSVNTTLSSIIFQEKKKLL